jgi:DNA-binding protein HU-beta
VPPELEQMLRAEMSRKAPAASMSEPAPMVASMPVETISGSASAAKPAPRARTTKAASAEAGSSEEAPKVTRTRTTKPATTKTTTTRTRKAAPAEGDAGTAPKKPAARTRKAAAPAEPAQSVEEL